MHPTTFGDFKAGHILVELLNKDDLPEKEKRKIKRTLAAFSQDIAALAVLKPFTRRRRVGLLVYKVAREELSKIETEKLKTYSLNVLNTLFKTFLRNTHASVTQLG